MIVSLIYLVSLASAAGALLLWRCYRLLNACTRTKVLLFIRKQLLYRLIYRRRNSSDNVNVLSLFNICLLIAANITACALKFRDRGELARRCGRLFLVNMVHQQLRRCYLERLQRYREHVSKVVANRLNAAEAATPLLSHKHQHALLYRAGNPTAIVHLATAQVLS
jgi:hypothetical protein